MPTICFGPIDHLLIIGGGALLARIAPKLESLGFAATIFTAPRHAEEPVTAEGLTLAEALRRADLPCFSSEEINDDERVPRHIHPTTLGVAMGPAWVFKKPLLELLAERFVNVHPIPLPRYRGGAHHSWRIMRRDRQWGCYIQLIEEELDVGDVIKAQEYVLPESARIPADDVAIVLEEGQQFLEEFLQQVREGTTFRRVRLDEATSSYFPRLSTAHHGYADWAWGTKDLEAFLCAFDNPYAGAATFLNGKRVRLKGCTAHADDGPFHPFQAGLIYRKGPEGVSVATHDGTLVIKTVLNDAGENLVSQLRLGQRFYTPRRYVEAAMMDRAGYDARGLRLKTVGAG